MKRILMLIGIAMFAISTCCALASESFAISTEGEYQSYAGEVYSIDINDIGKVAAGGKAHSVVLMKNGDIYAFGNNEKGELGDGTNLKRLEPQKVKLQDVKTVSISAGDEHSLALTSDGNIYAWGSSASGRLGVISRVNAITPINVPIPSKTGKWIAVDGGGKHSVAILSNGVVYTWGDNSYGQLGDATKTVRYAPVKTKLQVSMGKAISVAAGADHTLALMEDGVVYGWGKNYNGQLGIGTGGVYSSPVKLNLPSALKATAVAAGDNHSLILMGNGTVYACGRNKEGQLGNDVDSVQETLPVKVLFPEEAGMVVSIVAGANHNLALMEDGSVYVWGWNRYFQVGYSEGKNLTKPVKLRLPIGNGTAVAIGAGANHSIVLMSSGNFYTMGSNESGQLGIKNTQDMPSLTRVSLLSNQ